MEKGHEPPWNVTSDSRQSLGPASPISSCLLDSSPHHSESSGQPAIQGRPGQVSTVWQADHRQVCDGFSSEEQRRKGHSH